MPPTKQTRTIRVILDAKDDSKKIVDSLSAIRKSVKGVERDVASLRGLKDVLYGVFAGSIITSWIKGLMDMSDSLTLTRERLHAFNGSYSQTEEIMKSLAEVAKTTRQPIDDISNSFANISISTKRMGLDVESQLATVQMLAQTFKLSGATAEMAAGGMTQLTQSFSRGVLRGQELVSVMSNNSTLAGILSAEADKLGKSIYEMGEKGQISMKWFFGVLSKHFDEINKKAKETRPTFQQGITLAVNELKVAIDDLNTSFNLSGGFYDSIKWLIENKDIVVTSLLAISLAFSGSMLPTILATTSAIMAAVTPWTLLAATIVSVVAFISMNWTTFNNALEQMGVQLQTVGIELQKFFLEFNRGVRDMVGDDSGVSRITEEIKALDNELKILDWRYKYLDEIIKNKKPDVPEYSPTRIDPSKIKDAKKSIQDQIAALNVSFANGKIGVEAYNASYLKLQKALLEEGVFQKGTKSFEDMNKEMSKNTLEAFARELEYGVITLTQFDEKVRLFNIEELDRKFKEGKISLEEYNIKLLELENSSELVKRAWTVGIAGGLSQASKNIGSAAQQIATVTSNAFGHMEDAIFQATKGATTSFADMTQAILDDLTKMAIRMAIIKPLIQGITGLWGTSDTASTPSGGKEGSTIMPFASGGVITSPTLFGSASKMGIMGEAGPEAIMPLTRMSDGSLGVASGGSGVTVNIVNQSGSEVQQSESTGPNGERIIDVLIVAKVKEGIASGQFDKTFSQSFGLRRRGV